MKGQKKAKEFQKDLCVTEFLTLVVSVRKILLLLLLLLLLLFLNGPTTALGCYLFSPWLPDVPQPLFRKIFHPVHFG